MFQLRQLRYAAALAFMAVLALLVAGCGSNEGVSMIRGEYIRGDSSDSMSRSLKITRNKMIYGMEKPDFYEARYEVVRVHGDTVTVTLIDEGHRFDIVVAEHGGGLEIDTDVDRAAYDKDPTLGFLAGFDGQWVRLD